ncbi:MAG TPA: ADOP family duplicated permease, partial [Candidatus Synoicihabitans sp.]|nr:ADOP family duplicated permease [Candidatus Synoicihabitans sp.]
CYPGAGVERGSSSLANYYDRREHVQAFESTAMHDEGSAIIGEAGSPQRVERDRVSPEFFATLGVPLALGRGFTEDEMLYANAQVMVLTHEFWQSHFQGDLNVLGRQLTVDGLSHVVVGVLPPGFRYLDRRARFFIPLASDLKERGPDRRHSNGVSLIARLKPGVTLAEARAQMAAFSATQLRDDPYAHLLKDAGYYVQVDWLHADVVREVRPVLLLLQAGVISLLLIGGVNLVNLLLIRAHGRAKEMAVRQALGAGRGDLARETVIETLMLSLAGGLLGLALGALGIHLLDALGTDRLPLGAQVLFDGRVAMVALAGSFVVGLALALPVVTLNLRRDLAPVLQSESRTGTSSRAAQRMRHAFIVVQVALAFVLLCGAGLLGLSLKKVLETSPGFDPQQVLTAQLRLPWKAYPEHEPRLAFLERLLAALQQQPGVIHAGFCGGLPFSGDVSDNATAVEGVERAPGESIRTHFTSFALGRYWQALGIPLLEGRYLEDADNHGKQKVCVVDAAFVQRYWPGQSALGRRIASDPTFTEHNALTIVGVVGTVKQRDMTDQSPLGTVYMPYRLRSDSGFSVVVRTAVPPETMGASLQRLVLSLDPSLPVDDIKVLQERIDDSLVTRRSPALLVGIFAAVALLLAAVGTYGVLAYTVNQRRREIGVRMALGAQPRQVLQQFLGLGLRLLLLGVSVGAFGAWAAGRAMSSLLFSVDGFHLGVVAATAAILLVVVLLATLLPSRRAARVSPLEALRDD